jgi:hypothetical protein
VPSFAESQVALSVCTENQDESFKALRTGYRSVYRPGRIAREMADPGDVQIARDRQVSGSFEQLSADQYQTLARRICLSDFHQIIHIYQHMVYGVNVVSRVKKEH